MLENDSLDCPESEDVPAEPEPILNEYQEIAGLDGGAREAGWGE